MKRITEHWLFALFDLVVVSISGALWFVFPQLSWQPLLLALWPWLLRLLTGRFPFRRTPLDALIGLFMLTAVSGAWLSYSPVLAWSKFWLIVASILLYYALAGQPAKNLWLLTGLIGSGALLAALYFLLTNQWQDQPTKVAILTRLGLAWSRIRPSLPAPAMHPNVAASLMAMSLPFLVVLGLRAWREREWVLGGYTAVAGGITLFALILTVSRGAVGALSAALGAWFLWAVSRPIAARLQRSRQIVFVVLWGVLGVSGLGLGLFLSGGLAEFVNTVGGAGVQGGRYELLLSTLRLIRDFRFTGSGLGTFAGLFSQYILVIPFFFVPHAHDLFLNVALEQGILGALALAGVYALSAWRLVQVRGKEYPQVIHGAWLRWGVAASMLVLLLHGLLDDTLYGQRGSPLLLLAAGMGMAVTHPFLTPEVRVNTSRTNRVRWIGAALGVALGLLLVYWPLPANWYANRGALVMAQAELAGWPFDEWDNGSRTAALAPASAQFAHALDLDAANITAQYRLGLIAMLERDYETAVAHLEIAHQRDPDHRGITKNLGYSYVWLGDFAKARPLLANISEAQQEMDVYVWWWRQQGRQDLSERAAQMSEP